MVDCFDADWAHEDFTPHPGSRLIWCPDNGGQRVAAFIDGARETLWVQIERYQDMVIIERLVRAASRGVKVHILSKPAHSLKAEKADRGRGRPAHPAGRRRQGAHHEAPEAAREDDAGGRRKVETSLRAGARRCGRARCRSGARDQRSSPALPCCSTVAQPAPLYSYKGCDAGAETATITAAWEKA